MSVRSVTLTTTETKEQRCRCGYVPCDGTCCGLDCLVQPRFFCGQLLTDQDLTTLLDWTQDKLRLTRYREGWGVVCGLDVRCDPKEPGRVIVEPGYAVSCCGDDIIVCEATPYDLSDACRTPEDACADLEWATEDEPAMAEFAGRRLPARELHLVDLYIRYKEEPANPQTALGRSVCREVAECEYGRTRETFELSWQPAISGSDPITAEAERWHEQYEKCLEVLDRFRSRFGPQIKRYSTEKQYTENDGRELAKTVQQWLVDWINQNPLHEFCFVHDWVCDMGPEELLNESELVKVLFWIVQDCRNAFLACDCHGCEEDSDVPLARVWLQGTTSRCKVLHIDAYPPYRRPISPECWPAPLGQVNLGQVIWHRWEDACRALTDLGLQTEQKQVDTPSSLKDLENWLRADRLFATCEERALVLVTNFELGLGHSRVIGVRPRTSDNNKPSEPRRDRLQNLPNIGRKGEANLYTAGYTTFADVANMGPEELRAILPERATPWKAEDLEATIKQAREEAEKEK